MKDKGKILTVINTSKKTADVSTAKETVIVGGGGGGVSSGGKSYWEFRKSEDGTAYLWSKYPVLTQYGITMYANMDNMEAPQIVDAIPFDNTTIWYNTEKNVVEVIGGGSSSFENIFENGTGNAYTSFTISEDNTSLTLVKGETFAKQSDFETLNTKVIDFLEGEDTDVIINKWKELETFLSGLEESDNLAEILSGKADKATTLAGYGITDAYTKTETDTLLKKYVTIAGSEDVTGVHNFVNGLEIGGIPMSKYSNGVLYIEGDVVVSGGVTMYGTSGSASTIMDGVLVDDRTISKTNGYLEVIGGTGGSIDYPLTWTGYSIGSWDGTSSATIEIPSKTSQISNDSGFVTLDDIDDVYLPITGGTLTGWLNIKSGSSNYGGYLYFGDRSYVYLHEDTDDHLLIYADKGVTIDTGSDGTLYIEGNLVVSGGITMYATDSSSSSTIMDGVLVDGTTISKTNGYLEVIGGGGGGVSSWDDLEDIPSYLGTSGLANSLSITVGSNSAVGYNGSTSKSLSINYSTLGLDERYLGVDDTILTLNGSTKDAGSASFYAPTSAGTSGYVLKSNGSGAPTWTAQSNITAGQATKVYINNSNANSVFPLVFADIRTCGSEGYNPIYVDTASGAGFNPSNNTMLLAGLYISDTSYYIETYTNGLEIGTYSLFKLTQDGTTKMSMSSAGNFFFYGSVSPNSNAGQDLGTSSYWWDNIYGTALLLRRTSTTQGGKIYFDSTTMHITNTSGSGSIYFDTNKSSSVSAAMWLTYDEKLWFRKGTGGRQVCIDGSGGSTCYYVGTSATWSMGSSYRNSSGTAVGVIGAYGAPNSIDYYYFGKAYNNYIFKVDTSGNVLASGGITMYSDIRKKNIINEELISIDKIANAPSFLYTFKDDKEKFVHLGSSAQYWQSINKDYVMDNDGTLSMGYGNIALTCAISISKEVLELKERIRELESEIEQLKN